jgi:hypothetical protein
LLNDNINGYASTEAHLNSGPGIGLVRKVALSYTGHAQQAEAFQALERCCAIGKPLHEETVRISDLSIFVAHQLVIFKRGVVNFQNAILNDVLQRTTLSLSSLAEQLHKSFPFSSEQCFVKVLQSAAKDRQSENQQDAPDASCCQAKHSALYHESHHKCHVAFLTCPNIHMN